MDCFLKSLGQKKGSNDLCVLHMRCQTTLMKEIYGEKTIPRGCDKTAG